MYLCVMVEYLDKKWALYAFEDDPGEVKAQIEFIPNCQRRLDEDEESILQWDPALVQVREMLVLKAAEQWPSWEPFAERIRNIPD